ncbi:MAG: hypothetical protein QXS02_05725, partial [Candidatus Thermoplasmatota archaeon]
MEKKAIVHVLDDLLGVRDVLACMIIDRGMDHIMPSFEKNDIGANRVISDVKQRVNSIFKMIDCYSTVELKEMKWAAIK